MSTLDACRPHHHSRGGPLTSTNRPACMWMVLQPMTKAKGGKWEVDTVRFRGFIKCA